MSQGQGSVGGSGCSENNFNSTYQSLRTLSILGIDLSLYYMHCII